VQSDAHVLLESGSAARPSTPSSRRRSWAKLDEIRLKIKGRVIIEGKLDAVAQNDQGGRAVGPQV
jgi:hypothetical protein